MSKLLDLYNERKKTAQENSYYKSASGESSSLLEKYQKIKADSGFTTSDRDHSRNPVRSYYETRVNPSLSRAWSEFVDAENQFLEYQKRIQNQEYLSDEDQKKYGDAVQRYLMSGGKVFTEENGFSDDAISKWQTQQAKIATGAAETADAYESFSSKEEFEHWKKRDTVEKRKEWYNTTTTRLSEIDNQLDAGGLSKEEKKSLKKERADLESKIKLYETGQKNEQGFSYGYKVADDYSDLTLNADFGEKSKPTIDFSAEAEEAEFNPDVYAETSVPLFQQDPLGYWLATNRGKVKGSAEIDARAKEGSWDELEQPEIDTYYYIMNTQGVGAAEQYLYDMKVELNRRKTYADTAKWAQKYEEGNIAQKIGMNVASVPANVFGAVPGFVENVGSWARGEAINPYTGGQKGMHYTNTVRGLTGSAIDEATGDKSFLGIKGSDVYQTGMSRADSMLATSLLGGTAGSAVLGMSAAQNKAYDLYQRGADDNQILIASVAAGAAEMAWEKMSYGKLKELGGGKFLGNMAIQGYNEFVEEAGTELTDIITDMVVMGRESEISELLEENNGDWGDVGLTLLGRVWKAGVGGFLGGAGASVTQTAKAKVGAQIYNRRVGKDIQSADGGVAALRTMAQEKAEAIGEIDKRQSRRLMRQAGNVNDNSSARKVGALYNSVLTASGTQNAAADQADIAKSLKRSGIEEGLADELATALVARYNGTASEAQNDLLDSLADDPDIHRAVQDIMENEKSTFGQRRQDVRDFVASVKEGSFSTKTAQTAAQTATKDATTDAAKEIDVADGTFVKSTGESVQSLKISKIDGGKVTVTVNGKTDVSLDDVSWDRGSTALAYQAVTETPGMTPAAANMILSNPKANNSAFLRQALDTFEAGIQGTEIQESLDTDVISSDEALALYMEGLKTVKAKADAIYNVYQRAKGILAKTGKKAQSGSFKISDGVDVTKFDSRQAAAAKLAAEIAAALGVDIVLYQDSNPRRFGYYSESADAIFLNVNARWGESVNAKFGEGGASMMAFTLSHELVHRAKAGSPLKFRSFSQYLIREYNKAGVSVDALVAQQIDAAEKAGVPISEDAAFEEVVCDACQRMLTDTDAGKKLAQWGSRSKSNSEFLQTVRDILTELLDNLRRLFKDVTNDSDAARAFRSLDKNVQQILADMFVDMSTDAAEKLSTIKAAGMLDQLVKTRDISYNLAAAETHMEKLASSITSQSSVPIDVLQQRYSKILRMWEKIGIKLNSNFLNEWNSKVGTDRTFNVFKAQSGYKYNIELSTMCKKGVPLFEAIDTIVRNEIMKELDTDTLGKAEKEILYDILKSSGFEIPCAICYVEQARQREGVIIDAFLNGKDGKLGWNSVLDAIESGMRDNGVDFSFESVSRNIATDNYTAADLNMDKATQDAFFSALMVEANKEITRYNKANKKDRALIESPTKDGIQKALKGNVPANLKVFKVLAMNPGSRFRIDGDLLYSSNTTRNLASAHHELYSLFNSQGGVSGYKTKQTPVVYWGDLLEKKWRPSDLRRGGGIRNQSNSDLQMYTLLDQVQMYIDLTAKGYYLQAYTKVVSELKLLGLSGAKINASLIPKVVVYFNTDGTVNFEKTSENAGLDEKGNPIFDDIEGIDHKEAFMLLEDPGYSKNVGGVCIGYSDNHIRKLLDDHRIQMVIGFHDKTNNPDKRYRGARYAKNYNGLNEARQLNSDGKYETVHVNFSAFLNQSEKMFRFDKSTETYEGTITYNGKEYNADDIPKLAADLYLEKYDTENAKPAYEEFKDHENYYKLLADFSLYDSQGHYSPHRKVAYNMPDTVPYLDDNGNKQTMPTQDYIQAELEKEMATRDELALQLADKSDQGIIPQFKKAITQAQNTTGNPGIRNKVSADEDAAYMRAVNSWDKETEQKLVDQAAVEAGAILDKDGKPLKLYRGTLGGQTTFAKGDTYGGKIYTIDNINVATRYGDKSGEATEIRHQTEGEKTTYALYGFPKKMLTIDAQYGVWSDLAIPEELRKYADGRYKATNAEIADWAEQEGYDALRIDNVRDGSFDHGSEVIFFNENAVKSADPVTYGNDGNVIPLSERFTEGRNDLRYKVSADEDLSDATILSRVSEENITPGQKHNLQVYRERLAKVEEQKKAVEKVSDELSKVRQSNDPGKEAKIRSLRIQLQKEKNRLKIHTDKLDAVVNSAPIRELIAKERESAEIRDKESIDRILSEMRGKYGTIPAGEKAVRDDSLPVSTKDDNKVSRSARTVKGAAVTTDEMAQMVDREVANGRLTYIPITNEDTAAMANSWVKKLGWESAKAEWYKDVNKGKAGADMAARGAVLLNNAAQAGDVDTWRELLFHFQKLSTNTAQGLQAMRILKQLEPTDKLYMIDRSVKQMIEDMNLKVDVEVDPDLQEEFLNAETDEQRDEIIDKIQKDVASQIPSTLIDKFNALRYLNMLGNLRTQVRNILGNFTMQTLNEVKNVIATGVQQIVYLASGKTYKKNRAIFASKKLIGQTYADYSNVKSLLLSGARYSTETAESSEFARKVNEYRRIFWKTPLDLLERYRKLTNWATDTGDLLFSKSAFVMAEARFLKARGIKDINDASPELLDEARAFAVAEAQEQTFRDTNWLSGWVTKIGRRPDTPAIGKAFSEGVAPFRKTPANILVRAVEYSPAGIVVSSVKTAQKLLKDTNVTGDQLINSWAKSLTGTGLFVLGAWLSAVGVLSGGASDDEDKDKFDKMYGQQNFALTIGEKNYTFDWMSPAAISILMGAQFNEIRQEGKVEWKDLESAITSLGEPMIEISMLQGVKDVLDNVQYAKSNLGQMVVNVSLSYLTQGLGNSLVGQIERSFEKNRETTYVDNDSAIPAWLQRTIGQFSNKVPGWDYNQIPYINAWGEEEETPNVAGNAWRNMVSPSYSDEFEKDAVYDELVRLNEAQDDKNVFPNTPSKTYTDPDDDKAVKRNLTAEEYVALAKAQGTTQRKLVEKMISNPTYKRMDDTDKAKAISFAYTYAKEKAQIDVLGRKDFSAKWMRAIGGGDPVYAILAHVNEY